MLKPLCSRLGWLCVFASMAFFASSAHAQISDTTPPNMVAISFAPTIDVTSGPKTVMVTATVTDNLAGVSGVTVVFTSPSGLQSNNQFLSRISGTSLNGVYQGLVPIPQFSEAGTWTLSAVQLRDSANNSVTITTATVQGLGFPTTLNVVSVQDIQPPQVIALGIAPQTIDVSNGAQNLTITLSVTDNLSGVDLPPAGFLGFAVTYQSPSGKQQQFSATSDFQLISGNTLNGVWRATHSFPKLSEPGIWTVVGLQVNDSARNFTNLNDATIRSLGLNPNFTVISSPSDTTPPQVTGLTFVPAVFDTSAQSQTVTFTMTIADDAAGVSFSPDSSNISFLHALQFRSPTNIQSVFSNTFGGSTLAGGTPLNGVWTGSVFFPQFSEAGTWTATLVGIKDSVNNQVTLTPPQLASAGLPFEVVLFSPSHVADGGVNAAGGTVNDQVFGDRAALTFPPGVVSVRTTVAIDVLSDSDPLKNNLPPPPTGFKDKDGTLFVNVDLNPKPAMPLPAPGLTVVLPFSQPKTPGIPIALYHLDAMTGGWIPDVDVTGAVVTGVVNADGLSATFTGVARLSTLAGFFPVGTPGDVDGDGVVNCVDLAIVKASFNKKTGQAGFDSRADVNRNGVVDISDLAVVSRRLPAGTTCF